MTSSHTNRRTGIVCLLLALAVMAIYWPTYHYGFVDYDDNDYVFNNPTVRAGLSWWGIVWSLVDQHAGNWHPLTWLSHMLDCQLFGLDAGAHHLVNVLFHAANAVLLLLLLNSLTGSFWRSALVAALFALHPLRAESVAWISERKDVLSGFFFMLTLWTYVIYAKKKISVDAAAPSVDAPFFYRLSLLFFVLGLLAKPMLVTVPLVLLLVDFWPLNRFAGFARTGLKSEPVRGLLREKAPFFIFSTLFGAITFLAQRAGGALRDAPPRGIGLRMEDTVAGYLSYVEKLLWPENLACLYLRADAVPMKSLFLAALVLAAVSALTVFNLRRRPYLAMGWLWFLVMLLPVSGLITFGLQSTADRYTYLPSIGFFLALTWGLAGLAEFLSPPRARRFFLAIGGAVILMACAGLTRHQLAFWKDTQTLLAHAVEINRSRGVGDEALAVLAYKNGEHKYSLSHDQPAAQINPAPAPSP